MRKLETLTVENFKSIRSQTLKLSRLNVLIGANGSGKSNLVGVFPFVRRVVQRELQLYTGVAGGADRILHFGRKRSPSLTVAMEFAEADVLKGYRLSLVPTEEDRFVFREEAYWAREREQYGRPTLKRPLGSGHPESRLMQSKDEVAQHVVDDLFSYRLYHFHDTSSSAALKQTADVNDNRALKSNGGNLAAFLYLMRQTHPTHLRAIEETVQQVAPFFGGFELHPTEENAEKIRLEWRHRSSENYWNAGALSDGTLRFISLCALLLQPKLPSIILLDEPELGLHPAAIVILAGLLKSAATHSQVLLATQSVTLLNQFTPEEVMVTEREDESTIVRPLSEMDQRTWIEGYALGELWEMNAVGGRP